MTKTTCPTCDQGLRCGHCRFGPKGSEGGWCALPDAKPMAVGPKTPACGAFEWRAPSVLGEGTDARVYYRRVTNWELGLQNGDVLMFARPGDEPPPPGWAILSAAPGAGDAPRLDEQNARRLWSFLHMLAQRVGPLDDDDRATARELFEVADRALASPPGAPAADAAKERAEGAPRWDAEFPCACGHDHIAGEDGEDAGCDTCNCSTWRAPSPLPTTHGTTKEE